jgi:hypothetical protein
LDEAIRNQDWELAATVTAEMRGDNHHVIARNDMTSQEWTQSSIDKFISESDWGAVSKYIASMRDSNAAQHEARDPETSHPPGNDKTFAGPAQKRFGARSQLQHNRLQKEDLHSASSWDDETSFDSESSSSGSSVTPVDRSPRRDARKEFAC